MCAIQWTVTSVTYSVLHKGVFIDILNFNLFMNIIHSVFSIAFIGSTVLTNAQVIFQNISFEDALKKANAESKMIFVDVYTTWCGPCKRMDSQVFSNVAVGKRINRDFVSIKIDNEKSEDRAKMVPYNIKGYPTMLVLDRTGKELLRVYGFHDVDELIKQLDKLLPEHEQPLYKAKAELDKNTASKEVWQRNVMYFYQNEWSMYAEYAQKYFDKFGISALDNDFDKTIFPMVTLPLDHPIIQSILKDGTEGDDFWSFQKYKVLQLQSRAKLAKTKKESDDVRAEASAFYDYLFAMLQGDMEEKDTFMGSIFDGQQAFDTNHELQTPDEDSLKQSAGAGGKKRKKAKK